MVNDLLRDQKRQLEIFFGFKMSDHWDGNDFDAVWDELFENKLMMPDYEFLGKDWKFNDGIYSLSNDAIKWIVKHHCTISTLLFLRKCTMQNGKEMEKQNYCSVKTLYAHFRYSTNWEVEDVGAQASCQTWKNRMNGFFEKSERYRCLSVCDSDASKIYSNRVVSSLAKEAGENKVVSKYDAPLFYKIVNQDASMFQKELVFMNNRKKILSDKDALGPLWNRMTKNDRTIFEKYYDEKNESRIYSKLWKAYCNFIEDKPFYSERLRTPIEDDVRRPAAGDMDIDKERVYQRLSLMDDFILRYRFDQAFFDDFITFALKYYEDHERDLEDVSVKDYAELASRYATLPNSYTKKYLFCCALDSRKYEYNTGFLDTVKDSYTVAMATADWSTDYPWPHLPMKLADYLSDITFPAFESAFAYILCQSCAEEGIPLLVQRLEEYVGAFAGDVYNCALTGHLVNYANHNTDDFAVHHDYASAVPLNLDKNVLAIIRRIFDNIFCSDNTSGYPYKKNFGIDTKIFVPDFNNGALYAMWLKRRIKDCLEHK